MGAHGWVAGICQPWGQFFYLGAGWPQWKPLGIPGTHLPLKRGSWLIIITGKLPLHLLCIFVSCAAILAPLILTVKLRLGFCSNWNNHTLDVHLFIIKCNLLSI